MWTLPRNCSCITETIAHVTAFYYTNRGTFARMRNKLVLKIKQKPCSVRYTCTRAPQKHVHFQSHVTHLRTTEHALNRVCFIYVIRVFFRNLLFFFLFFYESLKLIWCELKTFLKGQKLIWRSPLYSHTRRTQLCRKTL